MNIASSTTDDRRLLPLRGIVESADHERIQALRARVHLAQEISEWGASPYSWGAMELAAVCRAPRWTQSGWAIPTAIAVRAALWPDRTHDEELLALVKEAFAWHLAEDLTVWQDLHATPWSTHGLVEYLDACRELVWSVADYVEHLGSDLLVHVGNASGLPDD